VRGCFVTGTDTGVGKTMLTAAIVAALRSRGAPVRAMKPVITGLDEAPEPVWPRDHELLARLAGQDPADTILFGFGPPVSPHLAAAQAGTELKLEEIVDGLRRAAGPGEALVVEGAGGLLVPLSRAASMRDLAKVLGLSVLVAARPGLGTINHTLLTLEAARTAGVAVAAVVLTPWPHDPSAIELSNRDTIAALGNVEVATLEELRAPDPGLLATAAAHLPLERWLA
jgi:dethiobiotin synthetase